MTNYYIDESDLVHYGIKGMKWGVRRYDVPGVRRATAKEAYKDATESAQAKMYYGEGAGVRRRLIKATVESKSRNPDYKKAYDHHTSAMRMDKAASKAKAQRKTQDTKDAVGRGAKHAKGFVNRMVGNTAATTATAAAAYAAYTWAKKTGIDKVVANNASKAYSAVKTAARTADIKRNFNVSDLLKDKR